MRSMRYGWCLVGCLTAMMGTLSAQHQMATVPPSTRYERSSMSRFFMGENWRSVWKTPIAVSVLDLATYGGGLTPFKEGGNQSRTLRFRGGDGKTYVFRSTDKFINRSLPDDVRDTPAAAFISDQSSAFHPTGQFIAAPLHSRFDLLQAVPELVILPDDPRLGEFRKVFAGLMGSIEVRPEGEDGTGTAFGAQGILDTEAMLAGLEASLDHRLDAREYLLARLLDLTFGDSDRAGDQWRWATFPQDGLLVYRPVVRDRDYAFMVADGVTGGMIRKVFPKFVNFSDHFSSLSAMTLMTQEFDRSQLAPLSWPAWDSVVTRVRAGLSDAALEEAVRKLPAEELPLSQDRLVTGLRARRDALRDYAWRFYQIVSRQADVFASEEADLAAIDRAADGSVRVQFYSEREAARPERERMAAFDRRFLPDETDEIRIYLRGGADRLTVRGTAEHSILVRVAGGAGDDVLIDSARVEHGGAQTAFYDAHGKNTLVPGQGTDIDTRAYVSSMQPLEKHDSGAPEPMKKAEALEERRGRFEDLIDHGDNWVEQRFRAGATRNWGTKNGFSPVIKLKAGIGAIVGVKRSSTHSGFRYEPYKSKTVLDVRYGTGSGGFAAGGSVDLRRTNSPLGFTFAGGFTQLETNRFFGYGNDTDTNGVGSGIVFRDEWKAEPALRVGYGSANWFSIGPILRSIVLKPDVGSRATTLFEANARFTQAGVQLLGQLDGRDDGANPHSGYTLKATVAYYPAVIDLPQPYTTSHLEGTAYLPLGKPTLAFRVGGSRVFAEGTVPLHDAAFVGGGHSLRGFTRDRFAGDAEAHGTAELRVPLFRATLLTRGTVGVFGFSDVGRVWLDGASPGGWHQGYGGGLSFASLGGAVTVAYGIGERKRFYLDYGMPF